jgi:gamma-glutamyl-gamma-aminobutyrate hydrolase PuuD
MFVNSMHHQALLLEPISKSPKAKVIRNLGGLIVTATAAYGLESTKSMVQWRVAEAIMIRDWGESRVAAVQWHPEELKDTALLKTFFDNKNRPAIEVVKESQPKLARKPGPKTKEAGKTEDDG